jgi:diphosphomevalonate decarboxylase
MGEHSVLHSYNSIAAAIDKYIYVTLSKGKSRKVRINSDYFGVYETYIHKMKFSKDFDLVLGVLEEYKEFLSEGIDIEIKSDFSPELGLGSSGALLVGVVSGVMMMLGKNLSKQKLLQETISVLHKIRRNSSGSDLAASIYGGVVYFNPNTRTVEVIEDTLPILVAYSGYKTKTEDVIERINKDFKGRGTELEDIYSENGKLTEIAVLAIRNRDYKALGKIMNSANKVLYEGLNLITNELQNIIKEFTESDFFYGAKASGAGLGDCAIAVVSPLSFRQKPATRHCRAALAMTDLEFSSDTNARMCGAMVKIIPISIVPGQLDRIGIVNKILGKKIHAKPIKTFGSAFASSNIALCKYWGKRDEELHLPMNSSLSISLDGLGSLTKISLSSEDKVKLNGEFLGYKSKFASKIFDFIDLFRQDNEWKFSVEINSNIPIAAGLASSAAGFAALVLALNDLFSWQLNVKDLSILARLGSGSAARSIESGFVLWRKGIRLDGMDSYAEKLPLDWPGLAVGILMVDGQEKHIASREAMRLSKETSPDFKSWTKQSEQDIKLIISAIKEKDFVQFGKILEENSNRMHKTMASSKPSIVYSTSETKNLISKIKFCREELGLPVFYTQDAGPNLVIFFEEKNAAEITSIFPNCMGVKIS